MIHAFSADDLTGRWGGHFPVRVRLPEDPSLARLNRYESGTTALVSPSGLVL